MKLLSSKQVQYAYIAVCTVVFIQLITGYCFTIQLVNIVLFVIVFGYPFVRFFIAQIPAWIKILVGLIIVGATILIANEVLIFLAFGTESEKKINVWKLDNRKIILTRRQGWAGPSYLRYDLVDHKFFGLFSKTIAYGYPDTEPCKITFENNNGGKSFEFDTCKNLLMKVDKNGR